MTFIDRTVFSSRCVAVVFGLGLVFSALPASFFVFSWQTVEAAVTIYGPVDSSAGTGSEFRSGGIDTEYYTNLVWEFDYDLVDLDNGDMFTYGWTDGANDHDLGTVSGVNADASALLPVSVTLPAAAEQPYIELYVLVTSSAGDDTLVLKNMTLTGTLNSGCTPQHHVANPTNIFNPTTGEYFETINDAMNDCDTEPGHTVELLGDITTAEQQNIAREITLDGNGHTITPTFSKTSNSNNAVLGVLTNSDSVVIRDLTIEAGGTAQLHGINVYQANNIEINNVTVRNVSHSALVVNGSDVAITDFTTSGSGWHAINVAQGSGVTAQSSLTVYNTSTHGEVWPPTPHIYVDDIDDDFAVDDIDDQYDYIEFPNPNDNLLTARAYYLKTPPDEEKPVFSFVSPIDEYVTNSDFTVTVSATDDTALDSVVVNIKDANGGHVGSCLNVNAGGVTNYTDSCVVDVDTLPEGEYQLRGNTRDEAGNLSTTLTQTFFVDRTGPTIVVDSPIDHFATGGDFNITVTATDDIELGQVVINLKDEFGGHIGTCLNQTISGVATATLSCTVDTAVLGEGIFQFRANARDAASNISNTITQTVIIDATRPVIVANAPVDNFITSDNFAITVTATDDTGIVQVVINLKDEFGNHIVTCLNESITATTSRTTSCTVDVSELGEGTYQFRTNARDESGNLSNTINQTFTIANAELTILAPTVDEMIYGSYNFTAYYQDDDNTEDDMQWAVRSGTCQASTNTVAGNVDGFTDSFSWDGADFSAVLDTSGWANGEYCLVINPKEQSGEIDLRATRTFTIANNQTCESGVNLVKNPSFELDVVTAGQGWALLDSITDWKVEKLGGGTAKAELQAGVFGWVSVDGNQHVELASNQQTQWSQTILTKPGETYTLTWHYAARPNTDKPESRMRVYLDGVEIATNNDDGDEDVVWSQHYYTFTATSSTVTITFADEGVNNGVGPLLDAVSLECNPTPVVDENSGGNDEGDAQDNDNDDTVQEDNTPPQTGNRVGGRLLQRGPTPQVLGASTDATYCPYLNDYLRIDWDNDPWEVIKLQLFLRLVMKYDNPITGFFGPVTYENVKKFQTAFTDEILQPWVTAGLATDLTPTGYVGKATKWKINDIVCPGFEAFSDLTQG